MVAHDEVVALLDHLRAPVVVAAELHRDVLVVQRNVVHVDAPVDDAHRVAFLGDDAFHEHLLGVERVVEHHDVAGPGFAELVHQLVDDQPVVVLERRRHAQAVDARHLDSKRDDQRGVNRSGQQRLDAGDDLVSHALPRAHVIHGFECAEHCGRRRARLDDRMNTRIGPRSGPRQVELAL